MKILYMNLKISLMKMPRNEEESEGAGKEEQGRKEFYLVQNISF